MAVKFDPAKHHRRSIRLKGYDYIQPGAYFVTICTHQRENLFGQVQDGRMETNRLGLIVQKAWLDLPCHYPHVQLDAFCLMPNHVHAIIVLVGDDVSSGGGLDVVSGGGRMDVVSRRGGSAPETDEAFSETDQLRGLDQTRKQTHPYQPAPDQTRKQTHPYDDRSHNVPDPMARHGLPEIVRAFKSFSARRINAALGRPGNPVWQRNYYEHIIRNQDEWQRIRDYIHANPARWDSDRVYRSGRDRR